MTKTAEAEIARALFPTILDGLLVAHPWGFSLRQALIEPEEVNSFDGYAYAFAMPADALRTVSARGTGHRNCVYRVFGTHILSDEPHLNLTYQRRPETDSFPAHFVQALTARLAAEFCLPITESSSRAEVLQKLASVELRLARLVDSQQSSARSIDDYTLIEVRQ